jgi:hypothetical protein
MNIILKVIKKSAIDVWDEMLYVIIFNVIWVVGTLLVVTYPFVTFGLFHTAHDIGLGKAIKMATFFAHGRRMLKPAYIWGGINLVVLVVIWFNLRFYEGIESQWAALAQMFFVSLALFWLVLQLIMLALYPRLVEPSFKLALRNAVIITGKHPLMVFSLLVLIALILVITSFLQAIVFLMTISVIAILTNNVVGALVDREIEQLEGEER